MATPVPRSVPVVLGVIFCDACNQFLIFPFIPFLVREQLGLAADDPNVPLFSGLLAAAYLLGQFICSPFYGGLSERLGRRPVLLVCVMISTLFLLAFGFSQNYVLSVVLRLLQGGFAGALTVGKLYLADVSDASNEGRVFSFIGIAIGSGCITGPALGGYLADPELLSLVPADHFVGGLLHAYPYLAPCLAGATVSLGVFLWAFVYMPESRVDLFSSRLATLGKPLLDSRSSSVGQGSPKLAHVGSSSLLEAMTAHASRTSLIVSDDGSGPSTPTSTLTESPGPVSAISLALKHSLSPTAQRRSLFVDTNAVQPVTKPVAVRVDPPSDSAPVGGGTLAGPRRQRVFWIIQIACVLFAMTNVGLTEVVPVWLSTPLPTTEASYWSSGLGLGPSLIGTLQSTTGVGNIVLALFVTYRIINALGPVRTFAISLFINAAAALAPPTILLLPDSCPFSVSLGVMCVAYSLVAASRNMMFATAIMLSKEAAAGAPGVAIGINQSACSLGSALGPVLTGIVYTQSLSTLRTCVPFFLSVGIVGALPGVLVVTQAPPWPWKPPNPSLLIQP